MVRFLERNSLRIHPFASSTMYSHLHQFFSWGNALDIFLQLCLFGFREQMEITFLGACDKREQADTNSNYQNNLMAKALSPKNGFLRFLRQD